MTSSSFTGFELDPRILNDTRPIASLPLSELVLMNDSRFTWLILVPRIADAAELLDLSPPQRLELWREIDRVSAMLRAEFPCDKLNIATLGNMVRQLHIHVIVRRVDDDAWPAPVWGVGSAVPYSEADLGNLLQELRHKLEAYS